MKRSGSLRARSPKTARMYVHRRRLVAELLAEHPVCEVPWCWDWATAVHEPLTRARGGSITDPANCRCVCDPHHVEIHTEAAWAYDLGFLAHSWDTS